MRELAILVQDVLKTLKRSVESSKRCLRIRR